MTRVMMLAGLEEVYSAEGAECDCCGLTSARVKTLTPKEVGGGGKSFLFYLNAHCLNY